MPDDVRCPGCAHARWHHDDEGCGALRQSLFSDGEEMDVCTLTPAEIDAVLAIRAAHDGAVPRDDRERELWNVGYAEAVRQEHEAK